jgi:hypothetical protein
MNKRPDMTVMIPGPIGHGGPNDITDPSYHRPVAIIGPRPPAHTVKPRPATTHTSSHVFDSYQFWGHEIPFSFGRRRLPGTVIWTSKINQIKGNRFIDVAVSFGYPLAPTAEQGRSELMALWANGKKIYTKASTSGLPPTGGKQVGATANASTKAKTSSKPAMSVVWHSGRAANKPDTTIRRDKGVNAVSFPGMMYCVIRNFNLTSAKISSPPTIEGLVVDSTEYDNHYERSSPFNEKIGNSFLRADLSMWNRNSHRLVTIETQNSMAFRIYDYARGRKQGRVAIKGTRLGGPHWVYNAMDLDPETGLAMVAGGTNGTPSNRALHVLNTKNGKLGAAFYDGAAPTQQIFNATSAGYVARTSIGHAADNSTEGLFAVAGSAVTTNSATAGTVGIVKINPKTYELNFIAVKQLALAPVHCVFSSDEARQQGFATFYVGCGTELYRIRIAKNATGATANSTVIVKRMLSLEVNNFIHGGLHDEHDNSLLLYMGSTVNATGVVKLPLPFPPGITSSALMIGISAWYSLIHPSSPPIQHERYIRRQDISLGTCAFYTGTGHDFNPVLGSVTIFNTDNGSFDHVDLRYAFDSSDPTANRTTKQFSVSNQPDMWWDSARGAFVCITPALEDIPIAPYFVSSTDVSTGPGLLYPSSIIFTSGFTKQIGTIIRWLLLAAGYTESQIDVADVLSIESCLGGIFIQKDDVWNTIGNICAVYGIAFYENGTTIKFVRRLRGIVPPHVDFNISAQDIVPDGSGQGVKIDLTRSQDIPYKVEISYLDPRMGYASNTRSSHRIKSPIKTVESNTSIQFTIPLIITGDTVSTLADRCLYAQWENRFLHSFTVTRKFLAAQPEDLISLTSTLTEGDTLVSYLRIRDTVLHDNYDVSIVANEVAHSNFAGSTTEEEPAQYDEEELVPGLGSDPIIFDVPTPEMTTATQANILSGTGNPVVSTWDGGTLYWNSAGTLLALHETSSVDEPLRLVTNDDLLPSVPWLLNNQFIDVAILRGSETKLFSVTAEGIFENENLALIGTGDDGYEYIQFQTVTQNLDGSYRLSNFVRGRRGTEGKIQLWPQGSVITLIDRNSLKDEVFTSLVGQSIEFSGVGPDEEPAVGTTETLLIEGNTLKPFGPINPRVIVGSWGAPLTVAFAPRTRGGYEWEDDDSLAAFPYEETPLFKVEIWDVTRTTLLRTVTGLSTPQFTYSAANQTTDFPGGQPTSLELTFYQNSGTVSVGYGFASMVRVRFF